MSGSFSLPPIALPPLLPISAQPIFQIGASSVDPNVTTAQAQVQLAAAQQQIAANAAQQAASAAAATAASNAAAAASLAAEQAAAAKAAVIPLTGQSNSFAPGTAPGTVGSLNDNAAGAGLLSPAGERNLSNLPGGVPAATEPTPPPPVPPPMQNPTNNVVLVSPDLGLAPLAFISPDSTAMTITDPNSGIATVDPLGNPAPAIVSSVTDVMRSASAAATIIASQARAAIGLLDPMSNAINIANALSRNADPISNVLTDVSNQLGVGPAQSPANQTAAFIQGAMVSAEGQPLPAGTSVGNDFHDLVAPPPVIPLAPVNLAPAPSVGSDIAALPIQFSPQRAIVHHHGG